jgi:hypothetical protein
MGWMRTLLLGDIGNRLDIADTERDIGALQARLASNIHADRDQEQRLEKLEREHLQLQLNVGSLLRLLVGKGVLSREELTAFVELLDRD